MSNTLRTMVLVCGAAFAVNLPAAVIYNNLPATNSMAAATRPDSTGGFEIETGDDFVLNSSFNVTSASFTGLNVPPTGGTFAVSQVVVEIYRVFPLDSNTSRTPNVPTRTNSPSDVALVSRDSAGNGLTFATTTLAATFTASNSVAAGGIHPLPGQTTGGNGAQTGREVQYDVTFNTPISLAAGHYFFIPQVLLSNGAQFYWLSASRPISGAGTTPFSPDLQAWTRDANLEPDWLRIGTDIVGGATPPTFDMSFALNGDAVPEPSSFLFAGMGLALLGLKAFRAR